MTNASKITQIAPVFVTFITYHLEQEKRYLQRNQVLNLTYNQIFLVWF